MQRSNKKLQKNNRKKSDDFQHREDALQIRADNLTEREIELTPAGQIVDMMGIVQTTARNSKTKEAAQLVQKFVAHNKEAIDRMYPKYREQLREEMQRWKEELLNDTRFNVTQQLNDYDSPDF